MDADELIGRINANLLERERLAMRVRALDDELPSLVGHNLNGIPEPERERLAATLYWEWDGLIPTELVAPLIGVEPHNVHRHMRPITIELHCEDCGRLFEAEVTSRTKMRELRRKSKWRHNRCPDCTAKKEAMTREIRVRHAEQSMNRESRLAELKKMPYADYLQTPEWAEVRKSALKRARFRCQICNRSGRLNVHHRTYERRGEELSSDVIVLCATCHSIYHENGRMPT